MSDHHDAGPSSPFDMTGEDALLRRIAQGAASGAVINLTVEPWQDPYTPVTRNPDDPADWDGLRVTASRLREIIIAAARERPPGEEPGAAPHGIHIRGLHIVGDLDLYNITLTFPLRFQKCRFERDIILGHATLETLEIAECRLRTLAGRGARINGNLRMPYSRCEGPVVLEGAQIMGWADLWGVEALRAGPNRGAFRARTGLPNALVDYYSDEYAHAVMLSVARIGNDLRLTELKAGGPLHMEELSVGKRLFLDEAKVAAYIPPGNDQETSPTEDSSAQARADRSYAVKGGGMRVQGHAVLSGSTFDGEVRLTGSEITGSLKMTGMRINSANHRSLMLDRSRIGGDLLFGDMKPYEPRQDDEDDRPEPASTLASSRRSTTLVGAVRMRKIVVKGDLNLSTTALNSGGYPNGFALRATGAEIEGEMIALELSARGTVDFANAHVKRKIRIVNCDFAWADETKRELNAAFEANHLVVDSDLVITRSRFRGPLYLQDAHVLGTFYSTASTLEGLDTYPAGPQDASAKKGRSQSAIAAERLQVGANIQISDQWRGDHGAGPAEEQGTYIGGISLADCKVDGGLYIYGGVFRGLPRPAVDKSAFGLTLPVNEAIHASGISVNRSVLISGHGTYWGVLNFEEASIEDEFRLEQVVLHPDRGHQSLRLALAKVRGSIVLGHVHAVLAPSFRTKNGMENLALPEARPVSVVSLGQINLSGSSVEGFLALQALHVHDPQVAGGSSAGGLGRDAAGTLSINASLCEVGKDFYAFLAHPEEAGGHRTPLERDALAVDPHLVSVTGGISVEQAEIRGNLSLDRMMLRARHSEEDREPEAFDALGGAAASRGHCFIAAGAKVWRTVYFGPDFHADGQVNFALAEVGQSFVHEGRIEADTAAAGAVGNRTAKALACHGLSVGVSVELRAPFAARGLVDFTQAAIHSNFRCLGATILPTERKALDLPGAQIGRKLILDRDSIFAGDVDLTAAQIMSDLEVWRHSFRPSSEGIPAVKAGRMRVAGTLFCGMSADQAQDAPDTDQPLDDPASSVPMNSDPDYRLDLTDARAGVLTDSPAAWPAEGRLQISGFVYDRIGESAPINAKERKTWLFRQPEGSLTTAFDPQPFEQLVRVLRTQGRPWEAESIDVAKASLRLKTMRNPFTRTYWRLFGLTMRYGYQPWRSIVALVLFAALGATVFGLAWNMKHPDDTVATSVADDTVTRRCIAPADPEYYFNRPEGRIETPTDYPKFHSLHFSFDLIIPIIDLRQAQYWIAASHEHCSLPSLMLRFDHAAPAQETAPSESDASPTGEAKNDVIFTVPLGFADVSVVHTRIYWFKFFESALIILGWLFASLFAVLITGLVQPRQPPST